MPIVEMTEKRLGIKAFVQNDANACAMAEWKYGAGKGYDNVVFLPLVREWVPGSSSTDAFIRVRAILPARWDTCACPGMGLWGSVRRVPSKAGAVAAVLRRWGRRWLANVSRWGPRPHIAGRLDELPAVTAKSIAEAAYAGDETARRFTGRWPAIWGADLR